MLLFKKILFKKISGETKDNERQLVDTIWHMYSMYSFSCCSICGPCCGTQVPLAVPINLLAAILKAADDLTTTTASTSQDVQSLGNRQQLLERSPSLYVIITSTWIVGTSGSFLCFLGLDPFLEAAVPSPWNMRLAWSTSKRFVCWCRKMFALQKMKKCNAMHACGFSCLEKVMKRRRFFACSLYSRSHATSDSANHSARCDAWELWPSTLHVAWPHPRNWWKPILDTWEIFWSLGGMEGKSVAQEFNNVSNTSNTWEWCRSSVGMYF